MALGPAAAACVFRPVEVGPAKEMLVGISLFSISSSLCKVGHVLFIPIGVQLEELLVYLLYCSFEYRRRSRGHFDLPLWYHNAVSFNVSVNLSRLLYMLTVGFGQELWRAAYIAKQRCGSEESVVKPHGFNIVKFDAREGIDCWKVDF